MNRLIALAGLVGLGAVLSSGAQAYSGVADVSFSWGETANPITWSWRFQNALTVVSNETLFQALTGSNQVSYFNSGFASAAGCTSAVLAVDGSATGITARKYGCRYLAGAGGPGFILLPSPPTDVGPAGAQAIGTLSFTDTTLTGVLAVSGTTDEPTGGTTTSVGDGASGFNVRSEDRSVFGGAWYGVSTGATLTVDLTGDFSAAGWEITGGTVRLTDPAFQCQQGGVGGTAPFFILCDPSSTLPGSYSSDGSHLSFGIDADGAGAGTLMREVEIWDGTGANIVATLSGVLASLTVGPAGVLATSFGEYRSGRGDGDLCTSKIRWTGDRISCGTLTVGPLQIMGTATPVDTAPDPFTFDALADVALDTLVTSNTITVTGIAAPARTTVAGGQYSVGCTGTFSSAASNVPDGATICVRHTSAAGPATNTVTTLNVGGVTGTFTSTTVPADTTPAPFTFNDQTGVALSTLITSDPLTITGIDAPAPVTVSGGTYSVGCTATYVSAPGNVSSSQTICVRHTSAAANSAQTSTILSVGGVADTFTSTSIAAGPSDTTPDPFLFQDQTAVALAVTVTSAAVSITGLTAPAAVSVSGGTHSVGCTATYVSTPGSVTNNQTVCVRHTSAASKGAVTSTSLSVGGVTDTFTSTTVADTSDTNPDPFAFTDQSGVAVSTVITSAPVIITGIDAPAPVTVAGGTYSIGCAGPFVSTPGSVTNNQTICVRHRSAAANSSQISTTLTVGGSSGSFTSTTFAATSGGGGGGGGGGAVHPLMLGILVVLPALRRRRTALDTGG